MRLPGIAALTALWIGIIAALFWLPQMLPEVILPMLAVAAALLPVITVIYAVLPVPSLWRIDGRELALALLLLTTALGLFGRFFANDAVNSLFAESPQAFPVAHSFATMLGAVLGLVLILMMLGVVFAVVLTPVLVFVCLVNWPGMQSFLVRSSVVFIILIAFGFVRGSLPPLEGVAVRAIERLALAADFHAAHRCDRAGWPADVSRVAFIGDGEVLGHVRQVPRPETGKRTDPGSDAPASWVTDRPATGQYVVLACKRLR